MADRLIGATITEVAASKSIETDYMALKELQDKLAPGTRISRHNYPTKEVTHYFSITLKLTDGTELDIVASQYYDSAWIEID